MSNKFFIIIIVILVSCSSKVKKTQSHDNIANDTVTSIGNHQSDIESEYLKIRNDEVVHFKGIDFSKASDSLNVLERKALLDLEIRLSKIMKNSHFAGVGKINLETLYQCLGFGMLDGLTFEKDSMRIFYTSKKIFIDYFKEVKIEQFDGLTQKNLETIFNNAFVSDAQLSSFGCIKIQSPSDIQAYGLVGMTYQMIGPWLPEYLYVFVSMDNYIYMVEKHLTKPIREILNCRSVYDKIYLESEKEFEKYRSSKLKDTIAFNRHLQLWNEAWEKYCNCYQRELINDSQFEEIKKQIEKIVDFLELENNK